MPTRSGRRLELTALYSTSESTQSGAFVDTNDVTLV